LGKPSGCSAVAQLRGGGGLGRVMGGDRGKCTDLEHFGDKISKIWWSPGYQRRRKETYLG